MASNDDDLTKVNLDGGYMTDPRSQHMPPYDTTHHSTRDTTHIDDFARRAVVTPRLAISVADAARRLGLSRGAAYEAIRRGEIPSVRIGRRIVVPIAMLDALMGLGR
jgi:excisionase family DNA binding protein